MNGLAANLEGKTIGNWVVGEKRRKTEEDNSGAFSSCYCVTHVETGKAAFLKALNFQYATKATGTGLSIDRIHELTSNFIYERNLLDLCSGKSMRRVVRALDYGEYSEDMEMLAVPYLVFEMADSSLKKKVVTENPPSLSWKLEVFHGALVGLSQLHAVKIAHQDLKPSNILIFGEAHSKIADLGNATMMGNESPHENGDWSHAPIELFYGHRSPSWETRRYGADFFMMGGILSYLISQTNFLSLLNCHLEPSHRFDRYRGSYEMVLPYLEASFSISLKTVLQDVPEYLRKDIESILKELCHPDPDKRGSRNFLNKSYPQFSLQPYISKVNRLSKLAGMNND